MINAEILKNAGIDYDDGLKRFMNDVTFYEMVLTAFAGENVLERAEEAYKAKDYEKLQKIVHEAKGSGGNVGLDSVYTEASTLVSLLRRPSFSEDELAEDYNRFVAAYTVAKNAIEAALK